MKPLLLKPILDKTIWGGNRLATIRNHPENIGTWWEVSAHSYGSNEITNLDEKTTLLEVIEKDPDGILGPGYTLHEMLRLAYLDSQEALSIQVHPDDNYAKKHAHDFGKFETWYILDASDDATLVAGVKIDDAKGIEAALHNQDLEKYLQKWPVHKGDYFIIPDGLIHAMGKNILALEIGTNSNTTYRFYDYGRKDKNGNTRPLHLKESFDVADFSLQPTYLKACKKNRQLTDNQYFTVDELWIDKDIFITTDQCYCIITNIDKETCIIEWNDEVIEIDGYGSLFVPYNAQEIRIVSNAHILYSRPKKEKNR